MIGRGPAQIQRVALHRLLRNHNHRHRPLWKFFNQISFGNRWIATMSVVNCVAVAVTNCMTIIIVFLCIIQLDMTHCRAESLAFNRANMYSDRVVSDFCINYYCIIVRYYYGWLVDIDYSWGSAWRKGAGWCCSRCHETLYPTHIQNCSCWLLPGVCVVVANKCRSFQD